MRNDIENFLFTVQAVFPKTFKPSNTPVKFPRSLAALRYASVSGESLTLTKGVLNISFHLHKMNSKVLVQLTLAMPVVELIRLMMFHSKYLKCLYAP